MENGATFRAKVFADATYEGDLMAQAGVSYTFGPRGHRASTASRSRAYASARRCISFRCRCRARDAAGTLLPEICGARRADPTARPTRSVQAYNFRLCMTQRTTTACRSRSRPATTRTLRAAGADARGHGPRSSAGREPARRNRKPGRPEEPAHAAMVAHGRDEAGPDPERQDRHEQQRRVLDRLHRRQLRLCRRRLRDARAHLAGARRLRPGLPVLPRSTIRRCRPRCTPR